MNFFLLLADTNGNPIPERTRKQLEHMRCCAALEVTWLDALSAAVMLGRDAHRLAGYGPTVSRWDSYVAAGDVRLDNRPDVLRWAGLHPAAAGDATDLELVVRAIAQQGDGVIPRILGDFAFVVWDLTSRRLVAARDAFGVKRLCYREGAHRLAFSSRAELLANGDSYDIQPLVEMIAMCDPSPDRTVYAGVRAAPPATLLRGRAGSLVAHEYWAPEAFEPTPVAPGREEECYEQFRSLFMGSVRQRLTGAANVWSQLSGGLDSSSVVSMAQWLAQQGVVPHGVSGTISWVYRWATDGDERMYSDVVAQQWGVRNEVMLDDWFWEDDGEEPPLTNEPDMAYPMYARDRRAWTLIRENGGHVLLTGLGSDQYLLGNMLFFADWIAQGRIGAAMGEMLRRAALGRVSFWDLAYQNVLLPLLPARVQYWLVPGARSPTWISSGLARKFGVEHTTDGRTFSGPRGRKYHSVVTEGVRSVHRILRHTLAIGNVLDVRHPFLSRPLIEFALRLPPEMCVRPYARKWVLREGMRGILPEPVRTRVGKGANFGTVLQSLKLERPRLTQLLVDPMLAQLGCVDPGQLRDAYRTACEVTDQHLVSAVLYSLALETWLQARSGRRIADAQLQVA